MNKTTKTFIPIIIVSFSFILVGCPICHDSDCIDKVIGRGSLNDSSLLWIPYNSIDTIKLTNSNGFHDFFISDGYFDDSINVQYRIYDENCGDPMEPCYELFKLPVKRITFNPSTINLPISIEIQKNISYSQINTTSVSDTLSDIIVIKINNENRTISQNCQNPAISNTIEYLDSISLNGKTHYNVIHSYIDSYGSEILLDGIYYTKSNGLIGFYLTNGEQWYLE